jgi:hypothetical protein
MAPELYQLHDRIQHSGPETANDHRSGTLVKLRTMKVGQAMTQFFHKRPTSTTVRPNPVSALGEVLALQSDWIMF